MEKLIHLFQGVECAEGKICELMEMSCGQEECNPIPICVGEPKLYSVQLTTNNKVVACVNSESTTYNIDM